MAYLPAVNIEQIATRALELAKNDLAQHGRVPAVALRIEDGVLDVQDVREFFADVAGKETLALIMRTSALLGADALGLVTEAWWAAPDKAPASGRGLEHAPGRRECIQVNVQAKTGWVTLSQFFGRDPKGAPVLEELETHRSSDPASTGWGGLMMNWYRVG